MHEKDGFASIENLGALLDASHIGAKNLYSILDTIPSAIVLVDVDGRFKYINKHGLELYGFAIPDRTAGNERL